MNIKLAACIAATLVIAASENASAADWLARAAEGCAIEREAPAACERSRTLVRSAMDAVAPKVASSGPAAGVPLSRAAAAVAAYVVLEHLYPEQQPDLERLLAIELADFPESQAKADALVQGREAGQRVLR